MINRVTFLFDFALGDCQVSGFGTVDHRVALTHTCIPAISYIKTLETRQEELGSPSLFLPVLSLLPSILTHPSLNRSVRAKKQQRQKECHKKPALQPTTAPRPKVSPLTTPTTTRKSRSRRRTRKNLGSGLRSVYWGLWTRREVTMHCWRIRLSRVWWMRPRLLIGMFSLACRLVSVFFFFSYLLFSIFKRGGSRQDSEIGGL